MESQVAKLSPTLACFIQQCKGTLGSEKWDEVRMSDPLELDELTVKKHMKNMLYPLRSQHGTSHPHSQIKQWKVTSASMIFLNSRRTEDLKELLAIPVDKKLFSAVILKKSPQLSNGCR